MAVPVTLPEIALVTVKLVSVPTLVREEAVTPEARVVPVKVPAGAVPVMLMPAVPAEMLAAVILVRLAPLTAPNDPLQVPVVMVPTVVKEEAVTPEARVLPVKVPAGATTAAVLAVVSLPWASTVKVGIAVEEP